MSSPVETGLVSASQPSHIPRARRAAALVGLLCAVLVMVLSLTAFVGGSSGDHLRGITVGDRAVDFSLRNRQEQRINLEHFRGRPVMLIFTNSALDLSAPVQLPEELAVVVVTSGSLAHATDFEQRLGRRITALHDVGGEVAERYAIASFPALVMIDSEGYIAGRGPLVGLVASAPQQHPAAVQQQ